MMEEKKKDKLCIFRWNLRIWLAAGLCESTSCTSAVWLRTRVSLEAQNRPAPWKEPRSLVAPRAAAALLEPLEQRSAFRSPRWSEKSWNGPVGHFEGGHSGTFPRLSIRRSGLWVCARCKQRQNHVEVRPTSGGCSLRRDIEQVFSRFPNKQTHVRVAGSVRTFSSVLNFRRTRCGFYLQSF